MAKLVLSLNGNLLNQYFIDKACLGIGRDTTNDIVINNALLSREHARIVSFGEDHIVEDLQSSNGSLINGRPLMRQILQHRDVIELGGYQLCYLNSRMAGDVDLERTMLIKAQPGNGAPPPELPGFAMPAVHASRSSWPEGRVRVLAGNAGKHAIGDSVGLEGVVTTFGNPGEQLVVIARRPQGYFITHVEGTKFPSVNHQLINDRPHALSNGDLIEVAGYRLEFRLGRFGDQ